MPYKAYNRHEDDTDWHEETWDANTNGQNDDIPKGYDGVFDFLGFSFIKFIVNLQIIVGTKVKQKTIHTMTTISLHNLTEKIKYGYITLIGEYGRQYRNPALHIPGYGWVPCSRKLQNNFTTNPSDLMLVISDDDDVYRPVTSDIWVTRSNIVKSFSL